MCDILNLRTSNINRFNEGRLFLTKKKKAKSKRYSTETISDLAVLANIIVTDKYL